MLTSAIFVLLIITGLLNPLDYELEHTLDIELRNRQQMVIRSSDNIAAHGIAFSQDLGTRLDQALQQHNVTITDLNNHPVLISKVQNALYDTVKDYMQKTPCSGAFFVLKATVNTAQEHPTYTCLFLKYANLYSDNTLHNDICMIRGQADVARQNNINLYSTWQMEWDSSRVAMGQEVLSQKNVPLQQSYRMTPMIEVKDSWEKVRLFLIPIYDDKGQAVGFCGFEFSDLFYKLQTPHSSYNDTPLISGFLDVDDNDTYSGQLSDEETLGDWPLIAKQTNSKYTTFISSGNTYIGKMLPVKIGPAVHYISIMLPENSYNELLNQSRGKALFSFGFILILFAISGYLLNKKYVEPIISDLQQLRQDPSCQPSSQLQEIDEIFASWRHKDYQNQEKLLSMEQERTYARQEYEQAVNRLQSISQEQSRLQQQYNELQATLLEQSRKLEEQLAALQQEKEAAQRQYASAQYIIKGYLDKDAPPIDNDCYKLFVDNISQLTAKEKAIFDLYVEGLVPKEVTGKLDITENTLKYHNKNIYSKLGVKNRKELLACIKYMQLSEQKN